MKRPNHMLTAALSYAQRGWFVFPIGPRGKKPIHKGGFKNATNDPDQIRRWWEQCPQANIGIATGARSGICVLDVDVKNGKDGEASLRALLNGHEGLPPTLEARTPSGGRHLIFAGCGLRCSADKLGPGLDVRAEGGYIVAAPSVTDEGRYKWSNDAAIAPVPDWFVAAADPKTESAKPTPKVIDTTALLERLRGALKFLRKEADDREFWLKVGWAISRDTNQSKEGYGLWLEWSQQSPKHDPQRDPKEMRIEYFEKSAQPHERPVHVATIFQRAYEAGWRPYRPCTDLGNAERIADAGEGKLKYCAQLDRWLEWNGVRWCPDEDGLAMRVAKAVARGIYAEAQAETDPTRRAALARWAAVSESVGRLKAAVELARSETRLLVNVNQLDSDPWLLGVQNGVLDLRTGTLCQTVPELFITKQANVDFDPNAKCPNWDAFVRRSLGGDPELIQYIQKAVGYWITGDTMERLFFFLCGERTGTGKSTFTSTLLALCGDYAVKAKSEILMRASFVNPGRPQPEVLALRGARLVIATELSDEQRFNEEQLKDFVGGTDTIIARTLHSKDMTPFIPTLKLVLYGNKKPKLRADDDAVWGRLHLIPFNHEVPRAERDKNLPEKLRREFSGILNWALAGCAAWREASTLDAPKSVLLASEEYRDEQDVIGQFIEERCALEKTAWAWGGPLYANYKTWCHENGYKHPVNNNRFATALSSKGCTRKTIDGKSKWVGIGVVSQRTPDGKWDA